MSAERERPVKTPEPDATGVYPLPPPTAATAELSPSGPEQTPDGPSVMPTGEYLPAEAAWVRREPKNERDAPGDATLPLSGPEGAEGNPPAEACGSDPQATELLDGQASGDAARPAESPTPDAAGVYAPEQNQAGLATEPLGPGVHPSTPAGHPPDATGAYAPEALAATGVYQPEATRVPAKQGTVDYDPNATGAFVEKDTGVPGAADPSAATEDFTKLQAGATIDRTPAKQQPAASGASEVGRYVLKRFHAKGGMGEIWLAEDPAIGRPVALKRMLGRRPDQQRRFRVEAQVTGQLEHPGIVPVHELGTTEEGLPFYAMKFVRGRTLQKVVQEYHQKAADAGDGEVEQFRLLQIFISLCQTVAYAHSRGVLHRDLKPENVMLGPYGETLLLDWGIAKVLGRPEDASAGGEAAYVHLEEVATETGTQAGSIMGSPSYMAPEVAAGLNEEVDERSDVYLLGATLYEVLTGRLPREGKTALEMIKKAQREPPVPPRKVNPRVSKALDAICLKAMASQKEDRYPSALALAEDVQRYVAGEPVSVCPEGWAARTWRWAKRHRKALVRSAGAVLVVGLLAFGAWKLQEAEERRLEDLRASEERRRDALRETERLQQLERARSDVKEFRRLADEARFYAATTDPVAEHSPYFDPHQGETRMRGAIALAGSWGAGLERLPLKAEIPALKKELYDLYLLLAQTRGRPGAGAQAARAVLGLLAKAGALRPPSRGYYRFRARAYALLGQRQKAARDRRRAEEARTPVTSLDHFLLGEQYRKESAGKAGGPAEQKSWQPNPKRIGKAVEQYRLALAIDPDHYWSHFQLGRCYLGQGRLPEAVAALGACVALRPAAPWGYSVRGFALSQQKRYPEAERDLNRAVELNPDARVPRLNRGVVYWQQKKHTQALADFAAVLTPPKEKRLVEAAYYRGQLYLQLGKVKSALEDFDRVVAGNPRFRPVYPVRARIYIARGNIARGLADLDAYLADGPSYDPRTWQACARRGRLLRLLHADLPPDQRRQPSARGLAALAVAELQKAVKQGGRAAEVFDDLGAMFEMSGRVKEAVAAYTDGVKVAPKDVKLLNKRGWAYDQIGQRNKSLADFTEAARIDPENAEAHSGLGFVRALQKLPPEAQREADLALLHGGDNYLILHNVACIYTALAQADERRATAFQDVAVALLRRAVQLWKKAGTGPDEIQLIKLDPTFQPLGDRPDFQGLLRDGQGRHD